MVAHVVIPIIIIVVLIVLLVVTGYIGDPLVDIPSLAIIGFLSYRMAYVIMKTRGRNLYGYEGLKGEAVEDIVPGKDGFVIVNGEYWRAVSDEPLRRGDRIVVVRRDGLKLYVKRELPNEKA